jgi:hypothetical protein
VRDACSSLAAAASSGVCTAAETPLPVTPEGRPAAAALEDLDVAGEDNIAGCAASHAPRMLSVANRAPLSAPWRRASSAALHTMAHS